MIEVSNSINNGKTFKVSVPEDKGAAAQTIWAPGIIADVWRTKTFRGPTGQQTASGGPKPHIMPGQQANRNGGPRPHRQNGRNWDNNRRKPQFNPRNQQSRPEFRDFSQRQNPAPYYREAQRDPGYEPPYQPQRPDPLRYEGPYPMPYQPERRPLFFYDY